MFFVIDSDLNITKAKEVKENKEDKEVNKMKYPIFKSKVKLNEEQKEFRKKVEQNMKLTNTFAKLANPQGELYRELNRAYNFIDSLGYPHLLKKTEYKTNEELALDKELRILEKKIDSICSDIRVSKELLELKDSELKQNWYENSYVELSEIRVLDLIPTINNVKIAFISLIDSLKEEKKEPALKRNNRLFNGFVKICKNIEYMKNEIIDIKYNEMKKDCVKTAPINIDFPIYNNFKNNVNSNIESNQSNQSDTQQKTDDYEEITIEDELYYKDNGNRLDGFNNDEYSYDPDECKDEELCLYSFKNIKEDIKSEVKPEIKSDILSNKIIKDYEKYKELTKEANEILKKINTNIGKLKKERELNKQEKNIKEEAKEIKDREIMYESLNNLIMELLKGKGGKIFVRPHFRRKSVFTKNEYKQKTFLLFTQTKEEKKETQDALKFINKNLVISVNSNNVNNNIKDRLKSKAEESIKKSNKKLINNNQFKCKFKIHNKI